MNEIRILVLERGNVLVCRCGDPSSYPFWIPFTDGRIIRRWGTTKGLAELKNGPTSDTTLDDLFSGTIPVRSVIFTQDVDQKKWEKHLKGK